MALAAEPGARRLRPLPWQDEPWQRLRGALAAGQLPHALLLEGSPGTGRNHLALTLARLLLCDAPDDSGNCGECRACSLGVAGSHPDLRSVQPVEEGRAIGVDAIRTAIEFLAGTASHGSRKVVLLSPAERLTTAAFNAFLKNLEEPSPGTFLLLVTARGHPVPATIRSRCQRWRLPGPDPEQGSRWLREHLSAAGGASEDDIATLSFLGGRQPLHMLALYEAQQWKPLAALDESLRTLAETTSAQEARRTSRQLESVAGQVHAGPLLDRLEVHTRHWLRNQPPAVLRSERGRAAFRALDEIASLRSAQRAGSNPNADLLRHRAVQATTAALAYR